jgi:hypothetical protein
MKAPDSEAPLDPAQAQLLQRVRRLAIASSLVMLVGLLAVFGVIGYRLFAGAERGRPAPDLTVALPKGARVVATAVAEGKLAVTLEIGGATEVRFYDLSTLEARGRLRLVPEP